MPRTVENVLVRYDPPADSAVPVVLDSPHSGAVYPPDFGHACPERLLREVEDAAVDALIATAPAHGAGLICALFPRSYIDVNRALDDLDEHLLDAPWPEAVAGGEKSRLGMGLINRFCRPGVAMYDRRLSVAEVRMRIERFYLPYHEALAEMLDAAWARHGRVWYLDWHSMPSAAVSARERAARERADFVIGDRDGTTAEPAFTAFLAETLRDLGYAVRINDPYKGVELIRRHGRPRDGRNAVQIEINRSLYMDERTLERGPGFAALAADIDRLIGAVSCYARDAVRQSPAAG